MNRKHIYNTIKIIIIVYCLVGIAIFNLQDKLLFHPEKKGRNESFSSNLLYKEINIPYNDSANMNVVQFLSQDSQHIKGVVLYFHGNKKNIDWYAGFAPNFTKHGYEVWMMDYPGFGKSTGVLTEQRMYDFAFQLYKLARTRFAKNEIIVYGKSMGTGIAAQLASVKDCRALVLETPYYSIRSLFQTYLFMYPLNNMIHYYLPTFQYLQKVDAPVTILHGTEDGVIPISNARKLQPFLKKTDKFITIINASHNNLQSFPAFQHALDSVLTQ